MQRKIYYCVEFDRPLGSAAALLCLRIKWKYFSKEQVTVYTLFCIYGRQHFPHPVTQML